MALGVAWGIIAVNTGFIDFTQDWIAPFGTIFINLLMLIAVPLVLASLIKGVSSLSNIARLSTLGGKTLALYLITTVFAVTLGLVLVNTFKPGDSISEETKQDLMDKYATKTTEKLEAAEAVKESGPLALLVEVIPSNIFNSFTNNKNMLQVIFFAVLFGIALILIPKEKAEPMVKLFDSLNAVIIRIVEIVMKFAPIGVFALLAGVLTGFGEDIMELITALAYYAGVVLIGLLFLGFVFYPLVLKIFFGYPLSRFYNGIRPAQLVAFSTSSSAATLPVTMRQVNEKLGVSKEITSFVLPLGATINMDGTSLYQAVAAVFIAQAFGIDLSLTQQLTIVLTATLASIGAAAVPGAGTIMLVIVLGSIGVDPAGIALVFAMDRPLDMVRTAVNVTGDATVATIVAKSEGQLTSSE